MQKIDIGRVSDSLIQLYRGAAGIEAAMRVQAMVNIGELDGRDIWKSIEQEVQRLNQPPPTASEPLS
jgi:hypothetical protein